MQMHRFHRCDLVPDHAKWRNRGRTMPKIAALAALFLTACIGHGAWHYYGYLRYEAAVERCQKAYASYPPAFAHLCQVTTNP